MGEALGQNVIVENKPGAGGNIGLAYAAKAAPDGYTIYLAAVTNAAIAAAAYAEKPVHLLKDFVPVAGVATMPHMLVVPTTWKTAPTCADMRQMLLGAATRRYRFSEAPSGAEGVHKILHQDKLSPDITPMKRTKHSKMTW